MRFEYRSVLLAALVLGGCAEKDSIFHDRAIKPGDQPHVVTVDAKQRHVLFNPQVLLDRQTGREISGDPLSTVSSPPAVEQPTASGEVEAGGTSSVATSQPSAPNGQPAVMAKLDAPSGTPNTLVAPPTVASGAPSNTSGTARRSNSQEPFKKDVKWRMCAEAAPDVFSAYAMSLSGKASADQKSFAATFGLSTSETAATISRTQAVNIIRESMYRTCERYLDGAINRTTLVTQAARDQRSMITFLAIEQLTGAIRSPVTIISGPGTSSALGAGAEAVKLVADFRKSAIDAKTAYGSAKTNFDKANKDVGCDSKDTPDEGADDAAKEAFKKCLDAKTALAEKSAANDKAQSQLDQALKVAAGAGTLAEVATQAVDNRIGGGANGGDVGSVAETVYRIVAASNINEALMFCIGYLSDNDVSDKTALLETCKNIMMDSAKADTYISKSLSFSANSDGAKILTFMTTGTEKEQTANFEKVMTALKSLNLPATPAAIVRITTNADPALSAAIFAYINAR